MAVIAGVAGGIGAATAAKMVAEGAYVVLGDFKREAGGAIAAGLEPAASFQICDVARESDVEALVAQAYLGDHSDISRAVRMLADESPLKGRAGLADDVANAVLCLACDESGYTRRLTLNVDADITTGSAAGAARFSEYRPMQREAGKMGMDA